MGRECQKSNQGQKRQHDNGNHDNKRKHGRQESRILHTSSEAWKGGKAASVPRQGHENDIDALSRHTRPRARNKLGFKKGVCVLRETANAFAGGACEGCSHLLQ